ncbi:MAG TPA: GNAT family N-acetyltransferase [Chitinophagales bacterium]|nr:GNAT family N-acetyltransferase [Chitinophagales bacterium]
MEITIKTFNYGSPEYEKALDLRNRILRIPLGLKFTPDELKKDETDTHLGLFTGDIISACLILSDAGNGRMKMRQVAVDDIFQRQGLGQKLSKAAEDYAKSKGIALMFCHARKTAAPFYEKMGYHVVGEEFIEVNIPHYVMEKALK